MRMFKLFSAALVVALFSQPGLAADIEAGKVKAQPCQACHGADGNTPIDPSYPKLAGQHASYLAKSLKDYRSGERANVVMAGFAGPLSDEEIENLAAYFASLPGDVHDLSHHE